MGTLMEIAAPTSHQQIRGLRSTERLLVFIALALGLGDAWRVTLGGSSTCWPRIKLGAFANAISAEHWKAT
jgi:hypothetical protein